jgi:ABC-2 type transport system ATP-binding protein
MIETRALTKIYPGPVAALQDVSLQLPTGMFGLLGPNGAGKSTLMRMLAGLLAPTAGRILIDGDDVTDAPERIWPRLGYLPQEFGLHPELSGKAMLRHLLLLKGVSAPGGLNALCDGLLERVNLGAVAHRPIATYSGGMRRRLGIAQAIAGDPRLVIVDEPTAGLDPEERARFHSLLAELAATRTVLLSTHLVEDVAMLCPQFAILRAGRLCARMTPAQARAMVAGSIFEAPATTAALRPDLRVTHRRWVEGQEWHRVHVTDAQPPPGFTAVAPNLEDAYMVLSQLP